jgi:hypothetical protein
LSGFSWSTVNRVVIVPVYNQSQYPTATFEIREALAAELQKLGRFEVVAPEPGYPDVLSRLIHVNGQFDEAEMLAVGQEFSADVVIHVAITQYSPYTRPRLGLIVQAVAPQEAKVVASVDGLWDVSCGDTAVRAREFFRAPQPTRMQQYLHGPPTPTDGYPDELALESPKLFQQFVCMELAQVLIPGVHR